MNKSIKKASFLLACGTMAFTAAACGGKKKANDVAPTEEFNIDDFLANLPDDIKNQEGIVQKDSVIAKSYMRKFLKKVSSETYNIEKFERFKGKINDTESGYQIHEFNQRDKNGVNYVFSEDIIIDGLNEDKRVVSDYYFLDTENNIRKYHKNGDSVTREKPLACLKNVRDAYHLKFENPVEDIVDGVAFVSWIQSFVDGTNTTDRYVFNLKEDYVQLDGKVCQEVVLKLNDKTWRIFDPNTDAYNNEVYENTLPEIEMSFYFEKDTEDFVGYKMDLTEELAESNIDMLSSYVTEYAYYVIYHDPVEIELPEDIKEEVSQQEFTSDPVYFTPPESLKEDEPTVLSLKTGFSSNSDNPLKYVRLYNEDHGLLGVVSPFALNGNKISYLKNNSDKKQTVEFVDRNIDVYWFGHRKQYVMVYVPENELYGIMFIGTNEEEMLKAIKEFEITYPHQATKPDEEIKVPDGNKDDGEKGDIIIDDQSNEDDEWDDEDSEEWPVKLDKNAIIRTNIKVADSGSEAGQIAEDIADSCDGIDNAHAKMDSTTDFHFVSDQNPMQLKPVTSSVEMFIGDDMLYSFNPDADKMEKPSDEFEITEKAYVYDDILYMKNVGKDEWTLNKQTADIYNVYGDMFRYACQPVFSKDATVEFDDKTKQYTITDSVFFQTGYCPGVSHLLDDLDAYHGAVKDPFDVKDLYEDEKVVFIYDENYRPISISFDSQMNFKKFWEMCAKEGKENGVDENTLAMYEEMAKAKEYYVRQEIDITFDRLGELKESEYKVPEEVIENAVDPMEEFFNSNNDEE